MRKRFTFAVGIPALGGLVATALTVVPALATPPSGASRAAAPAPPVCSAEDTRRNAVLDSPPYMRYCGPARAVVYVTWIRPPNDVITKTYRIRGGWCYPRRPTHRKTPRKRLVGVAVGLFVRSPQPPGLALTVDTLHAEPPVFSPRGGQAITVDDSAIEVPGTRLGASGIVVIGKRLNGGWFSLYGRLDTGPTGPLVSGTWSCS
jgi:hypothetical protein